MSLYIFSFIMVYYIIIGYPNYADRSTKAQLIQLSGLVFKIICFCFYLIFYHLLLSGDVELNPGPITGIFFKHCNRPIISTCIGDPKEVFRTHSDDLATAISDSLFQVTNKLYAKRLIPRQTKDRMFVAAIDNYTKASELVNVIERQLKSSRDPEQYLTKVCDILKCQQQQTLVDIAASMLGESSLHVNVPITEPDVQSYIDIMRQQYKDQPIVTDEDWPPKVGHGSFGRLALVEKSKMMKQERLAWCMLRGKVDELLEMPESNEITIGDVLQSPPLRVVIDGPPGIGKTTLCRKLLNMWSNGELPHQQFHLVLYCPLRNDKIATATTLTDLFVYKSPKVSKVAEWFLNEEGQGLLIIFDGWDELTTQLRETSLAASIIRREQLDKCSVVVTSRSYASSSLLRMSSINKHIQVIGFSLNEIKRVIIQTLQKDPKLAQELIEENTNKFSTISLKSHFTTAQNNKDSQLAVKLINDLNIRHDVRSLCYIPLVCSMVILVYHKGAGNLPTTLTELYEDFVLQTIRRHVAKRHGTTDDPYNLLSLSSLPSQLDKCLKDISQIAYTNLASTKMTFTLDQLQEQSLVNEDYLGLMTTFLEYDEKKHQFLHLSIQEFLAAWWIAKHENPEELFKNHFYDDHFQMCVRFVAGLTHLNNESYQKYFIIRNLDLQCIRIPFFGFNTDPLLYQNSAIAKYHATSSSSCNSDNFPILLFQLLYESQSTKLCQMLAKFITNSSLCLHEAKLSLFDTLCLSYFINNSNVTWEFLHLTVNSELLTSISTGTQCKKLQVEVDDGLIESFFQTKSFIYESNVQECHCTLYGDYSPCVALLHLLKLPQVKILHVTMNPDLNSKLADENVHSKLQKCIEADGKLQELAIRYYRQYESNELEENVIRGVAKNKVLTTFSLYVHRVDYIYKEGAEFSSFIDCSPLPAGIIEQLLKDNITLKNLELIIPDKLLSDEDCLNEIEVNTSLTTLVIGFTSKLKAPHTIETLAILEPQPQPPYPLLHDHPFLQVLILHLESFVDATELFEILQANTVLKSLSVNMNMSYLYDSTMCESLQFMLTKNNTLYSFEIEIRPLPFGIPEFPSPLFIASLTDGLECNTTIRKLSIPIRLPLLEDGEALFNLISQKNNFVELQLYVCHVVPSSSYISSDSSSGSGSSSPLLPLPSLSPSQYRDPTEVLFDEGLPTIIKMLQSLRSIRLLSMVWGPNYNESLVKDEIIWKFHETVFFHPSLEYVEISEMDELIDYFDRNRKSFITKLKQEHPLRSFPIVEYSS